MNVLYVVHQFYPEFTSGTERLTLNLAQAMQRAGHGVRVLTWTSGEVPADRIEPGPLAAFEPQPALAEERPGRGGLLVREYLHEGVPVSALAYPHPPVDIHHTLDPDPVLESAVNGVLDRVAVDVAHLTHTMRLSSTVDALTRRRIPYVLTLTDFFLPCHRINLVTVEGRLCAGPRAGAECVARCLVPGLSREYLGRRLRRSEDILYGAARVVVPSRFVQGRFAAEYADLPTTVVPHGIDYAELRPAPVALPPREELVVGFLGSLLPHKGVDILVRAFCRVEHSRLRLELFGEARDRPDFREELGRAAEGDARIRFHGAVDSRGVVEALRAMDVICIPSVVYESFSMVLHEAAAVGVPAIVSDIGALAEKVVDGVDGKHFETGSEDSLAAVLRAIAHEPALVQAWRDRLPLPPRVEDEAFLYESLYQAALARARIRDASRIPNTRAPAGEGGGPENSLVGWRRQAVGAVS